MNRWIEPSRWLRNVTPSSSTTRRSPSDTTWKPPRVGQDRPFPAHEPMEAAEALDPFVARPQVEVVRVGEDDRCADLDEVVRVERLDRGVRADRHELGRLDDAVTRWSVARAAPGCGHRPAAGRGPRNGPVRAGPRRSRRLLHGRSSTSSSAPPRAGDLRLRLARRRDLVAEPREMVRGRLGRRSGPAACDRGSRAEAGTARRRPRSSRSPPTARRRGQPRRPGPLPNFWMIAASSLRSVPSRPASSISTRRMASSAVASSIRPSPWTWAWSRTRLSSRFTIRGVPRPRRAIATAAARLDLDAEDPRPSARRSSVRSASS